ncbi:FMN-dependent NADH-azoreductase [Paenibacillus sp. UNCCL117]|uniref:NAD(P)H-dependent oxidoreductase n=1 Tax=unclassified Paenibacillus TaxID=185978 RepID=UPI000885A08B|nr:MULTISPECIES: NAD(P)H-dependent oxidoreductase [unclassified Paenibacillus]SDD84672.1 FMN-dependent NADH-azoreductase [Paenibacillus sp. cl123]SFW54569.1 FMN-dependent NADH-azoreductase [Paenibacillus sp. UNCCL117]
MATVLYITANPHDEEKSYSMLVGKEFVQAYRSANPYDEVIHLDLYKRDIPQLDKDVFSGWGKLKEGVAFDKLTEPEKMKLSRIGELVDQFVAADKYLFVNPIWNYSYPPVMKSYIDSICIAGKTFKYLPNIGRVGLLGDKKAVHIQASGSFLSSGSDDADLEMGHRHLKVIMDFVGVPSFEAIFVEGMAAKPELEPAIKEKAIQQAREVARRF